MTTPITSPRSRQQKAATAARVAGTPVQGRRRNAAKDAVPPTATERASQTKERATAVATAPPVPPEVAQARERTTATAEPPESKLVTWQEIPMPHVKVPVVHMAGTAARSMVTNVGWTARTIGSAVPQPRQLLYYGGVGLLTALGVLEWPVALAAAAGVWVATRSAQPAQPHGLAQLPGSEPEVKARPLAAAQ
ncbi:hypothetical protein Daura_19765 [Dactylosporangium aurantiacum]|uniref:Uncharacterized protein n=1 Tax=Dactylosporangium aurantiacum TaxID=35754 RepID=A0A9Q9IQX9_9ACTN|nr:hypothetical protein [Dactylosporangium aurantiacum]MDG6106298.1 hypothetical protein [Dactylosporangium aurantiacum]UWZ58207.1 hypothetical protein Daura_19765 [Dactylosporangium aurantiacum]